MNLEPPCTCERLDVDCYDVRGCELCDPESEWNREQLAAPEAEEIIPERKVA